MSAYAKAIAAFLTALVSLLAAFGFAADWATPSLIEAAASIAGALLSGFIVARVPNKS